MKNIENKSGLQLLFCFNTKIALLFLLFLITGACSGLNNIVTKPESAKSDRLIDVTCVDGKYVNKPVLATEKYEPEIAKENSQRIQAILKAVSDISCVIYFPGGNFYFDGAAEGWQGSIETTHPFQTICGAGMNGTRILQVSRSVSSTIRLRHTGCAVRDLYIGSADTNDTFNIDWEKAPHQTAIHLDSVVSDWKSWPCDPRIQNVNINSNGNTILGPYSYSRPFKTGIKISGSWLNIYVHTVWIMDTFTAIDIDQGPVMAGPAKFIDINFYSPHVAGGQKTQEWTTFFRSRSYFMEQVELIHCTFIGAQFIYMDSRPVQPKGELTPVYDMVVDHCYINVHDTPHSSASTEPYPERSGIYMNLQPLQAGKNSSYSRDIRFTNNSCTGRSTSQGAFFYLEGMCRGITIADNDISCGYGNDKCIYIRPTSQLNVDGVSKASDIGIRDVKIYNNYFRNWKTLITIGGDKQDPSRQSLPPQDVSAGKDTPSYRVQRVNIFNNQSMQESGTENVALTGCYLERCSQVVISGNNFAEKKSSGIVLRDCGNALVNSNSLVAIDSNDPAYGIAMFGCQSGAVTGNSLKKFRNGIYLDKCRQISLGNNVLDDAAYGISCMGSSQISLSGNIISGAEVGIESNKSKDVIMTGNIVQAEKSLKGVAESSRKNLILEDNIVSK